MTINSTQTIIGVQSATGWHWEGAIHRRCMGPQRKLHSQIGPFNQYTRNNALTSAERTGLMRYSTIAERHSRVYLLICMSTFSTPECIFLSVLVNEIQHLSIGLYYDLDLLLININS